MKPAFDLFIFDCDGVLVNSEPIANRILAEELSLIGIPTTTEQSIQTYMGRSSADSLGIITNILGFPPPGSFFERVRKRTREAFDKELKAIPGVERFIQSLTTPICVASSGGMDKIEKNLRLTGLKQYFDDTSIFSATTVKNGKPAPDLFLTAARAMGCDPVNCAVIEDSVPGVMAGKAAGMTVFGYSDLTPESELQNAGAITFTHMDDLPSLISSNIF